MQDTLPLLLVVPSPSSCIEQSLLLKMFPRIVHKLAVAVDDVVIGGVGIEGTGGVVHFGGVGVGVVAGKVRRRRGWRGW